MGQVAPGQCDGQQDQLSVGRGHQLLVRVEDLLPDPEGQVPPWTHLCIKAQLNLIQGPVHCVWVENRNNLERPEKKQALSISLLQVALDLVAPAASAAPGKTRGC